MTDSFKNFMSGIIDYAGLFPPAKLHLDSAVKEYLKHKKEPESWILNRFICPVSQLSELIGFRELISPQSLKMPLTILPSPAKSHQAFLDQLMVDLTQINQLVPATSDEFSVEVLEIKLSKAIFSDFNQESICGYLRRLQKLLVDFAADDMVLFLELVGKGIEPDDVHKLASAIAILADEVKTVVGVKVRCGGEHASAFPATEILAGYLYACAYNNIPLKATAGLHHPVRHFNSSVNTRMHGFLNVFGAALLAYQNRLTAAEIQEILENEDSSDFSFEDGKFILKNQEISTKDISILRKGKIFGFGSCSFTEPRQDLKKLGLL